MFTPLLYRFNQRERPSVVASILLVTIFSFFYCLDAIAASQSDAEQSASKSIVRDTEMPKNLERLIHKDTTEFLEVPPVYQRPLGIDSGPRIYVKKFVIEGVVDRPEFGITQQKIEEIAEDLRIKLQSIDVMNEFGLTQEDMDAVGKKLQDTLYSDDKGVIKTYEQFIEDLRKQKKFREEMSIGQLQDVANKITDYYRQTGLVVAQAYVPEQTITDGIVIIRVQEGVLGRTTITGNKSYSDEIIRELFVDLEGKTVTKQSVESALLLLGDYPGLIAYGVLQPGEASGETSLVIKVQDEISSGYTVGVDNHGSKSTGEYRLKLAYNYNNLFGNADDINLTLLQSFSPSNNLFGSLKYRTPFISTDYLVGIGLQSNAYDVGGDLAAFEVSGTVNSGNIFAGYQFVRSRKTNIYGRLELTNKVAETKVVDTVLSTDTLTSAAIEIGFDDLDVKHKGINQGNVRYTQGFAGLLDSLDETDLGVKGSREGGTPGAFGTSDFAKLNWSLARLQLVDKYQNMLFRFSGQLSRDLLAPVEQIGMGGPNNVRAFPVSEFVRDSSIFLSADWNFNAPGFYGASAFEGWKWGEIFQMSVFVDYSKGRQNDPLQGEDKNIDMSGYGVAAQLLLPGKIHIRLDVSKPANSPTGLKDVQYYLTMSYTG